MPAARLCFLLAMACGEPAPSSPGSTAAGPNDTAAEDTAAAVDTGTDTGSDTASGEDTAAEPDPETTPVRLNQLVVRLLRATEVTEDRRWVILRERPGWLFVTASSLLSEGQTVRVGVDVAGPEAAQLQVEAGKSPTEAMLEVPAGEHTVQVWLEGGATIQSLEVRAIPELRYDRYFPESGLDEDVVVNDWDFIERNAAPHLTTMVADWHWNAGALYVPWLASGRRWHTNSGNPYGTEAELAPVYDALVGVAEAGGIGLDLDEFGGTDDAQWTAWTAALSRASADHPDTPLALYTGALPDDSDAQRTFTRSMLALGHELLVEAYIGEKASEADLDAELDGLSETWSAARADFPGFEDQAVLVLGTALHSYVSYDYRPDVDFKVHLDRQFERVATDTNFQDLHGLAFWTSTYMDEETLRWMMALYRHYAIEGATTPLSTDPYVLPHVENPDFQGPDGWTLDTSGQIGLGEYEWVGEYEARWTSTEAVGDTYLYTTRGSGRASTATQTITGLEPGRSYSLRFATLWYEDLYNLRGDTYDYVRDHSVHATLDGVDLVDGSSVVVACDSTWPASGVWVNQHRQRFVARSETATLTLSDWQSETDPGGEVWETFFFNFVQVQPYFDE